MTALDVKKEALRLALENKRAEPRIQAFYWFPDATEVRLIEIEPNTIPSEFVEPFYFNSTSDFPAPSGIAIIRPEEFRKAKLPEDWGTWDNAEPLEIPE